MDTILKKVGLMNKPQRNKNTPNDPHRISDILLCILYSLLFCVAHPTLKFTP
jgi:hypothetical protein